MTPGLLEDSEPVVGLSLRKESQIAQAAAGKFGASSIVRFEPQSSSIAFSPANLALSPCSLQFWASFIAIAHRITMTDSPFSAQQTQSLAREHAAFSGCALGRRVAGALVLGSVLGLAGCEASTDSTPGSSAPVAGSGASAGAGGAVGAAGGGVTGGGGAPGGGTTTGGTGAAGGPVDSGAVRYTAPAGVLRRLTRSQIANAVFDLIGAQITIDDSFKDTYDGVFASVGAAKITSSDTDVEIFGSAIEAAVGEAFGSAAQRDALMGCAPQMAADACTRGYFERIGQRAWRRPLGAEELDQVVGVAELVETELGDVTEGVKWATVALLGSPNFLYRAELGMPGADGSFRLTRYEIAARLSFLLWDSVPDDQLMADAASGKLDTKEGVRASIERMMAMPAGRESVGTFADQYMRLDKVLELKKDPAAFPELSDTLRQAMIRDMRAVWEANAFDDQASVMELFTTDKAMVNSSLARIYGIDDAGLTEETFELRSLPADSPRRGILGKLAFLGPQANQKEGSPTLRGKFIRAAVMCLEVPLPPGNVVPVIPESPEGMPMTKRQRLEKHRTDPTCAGCHSLFDPMGVPFESFDALGRYREMEEGLPIDPSGEFDGTPVADSVELADVIAASDRVSGCLVQNYYSYAVGHEIRPGDASVVDGLKASFEASGYRLKDLIVEVASSDAFASVAPQAD